jgi:hypothetical protein
MEVSVLSQNTGASTLHKWGGKCCIFLDVSEFTSYSQKHAKLSIFTVIYCQVHYRMVGSV